VTLGIRPHDVAIVPPGAGLVDARVDVVEPRGSEVLVYVRLGAGDDAPEVRIVAPPETPVPDEGTVGLRLDPARLHWFDDASGRRLEG